MKLLKQPQDPILNKYDMFLKYILQIAIRITLSKQFLNQKGIETCSIDEQLL